MRDSLEAFRNHSKFVKNKKTNFSAECILISYTPRERRLSFALLQSTVTARRRSCRKIVYRLASESVCVCVLKRFAFHCSTPEMATLTNSSSNNTPGTRQNLLHFTFSLISLRLLQVSPAFARIKIGSTHFLQRQQPFSAIIVDFSCLLLPRTHFLQIEQQQQQQQQLPHQQHKQWNLKCDKHVQSGSSGGLFGPMCCLSMCRMLHSPTHLWAGIPLIASCQCAS